MKLQVKSRLEQIKQAKKIHGGMINMCAIAMGVRLSRVPIPSRKIREHVYRTIYGKKYFPLCEEEMEQPLREFRSLNALFTRGVRADKRPLSSVDGQVLCPCDGTVQDLGTLRKDNLLTAKGIEYSLNSLLPGLETEPFQDGSFSIFFLSPSDCHRVFCPIDAELHEVVHVPGRRLLVHPPYQRKEFPVFSLNERIIMRLETAFGRMLMVLVAGWGVGNITYPFAARCSVRRPRLLPPALRRRDKRIKPNKRVRMSRLKVTNARFPKPLSFSRGDWVATFELGSTVILLTEAQARAQSHLAPDMKVHYGQPAYTFSSDASLLQPAATQGIGS